MIESESLHPLVAGYFPGLPPTVPPTTGYTSETYEEMRGRLAVDRSFDKPDDSLVGNTYGLLYIESSAPHAMGIRYKWLCTHCGKRGGCPGSYIARGGRKTCGSPECRKALWAKRGRYT